jgi:hypothetical protein
MAPTNTNVGQSLPLLFGITRAEYLDSGIIENVANIYGIALTMANDLSE